MSDPVVRPRKSPRGKVQQQLTSISGYDLEGTPSQAAAKLMALYDTFPNRELELRYEKDRYEDSYSLYVYSWRDETDTEWSTRDALEQEQKRNRVWQLERALEQAKKESGT